MTDKQPEALPTAQDNRPLNKDEITQIVDTSLSAHYNRLKKDLIMPIESKIARHSDRIKLLEIAIGAAAEDRSSIREAVSANTRQIADLVPEIKALTKTTSEAIDGYRTLLDRTSNDMIQLRERIEHSENRTNSAIGQNDDILQRLNQMSGKLVITNAHIVTSTEAIAAIQRDYEAIALFAQDMRALSARIKGMIDFTKGVAKSKKTWSIITPFSIWFLERVGIVNEATRIIESIRSVLGV